MDPAINRLALAAQISADLGLANTELLEIVETINGEANQNEYHNFQHLLTVAINAYYLGRAYKAITKKDLVALFVAGLLHDVAYSPEWSEAVNITTAVNIAQKVIDTAKELHPLRKQIINLIEATYFPHTEPQTMLEEIIQDADLLQSLEEDGAVFLAGLEKEAKRVGKIDFKISENFPPLTMLNSQAAREQVSRGENYSAAHF